MPAFQLQEHALSCSGNLSHLYVACTKSMHHLYLYSASEVASSMTGMFDQLGAHSGG